MPNSGYKFSQLTCVRIYYERFNCGCILVLYMSFGRFLLAVEPRDLSQAGRSITYKSVFFLIVEWTSFSVSQQLRPELSAKYIGKIDALVNFIIQKFARLKSKQFSQFFWWEVNLRGLKAFILQKVQESVVERQKKRFCYLSLNFGKEGSHIILLSAWDRSRDSTAKRNLSKDM